MLPDRQTDRQTDGKKCCLEEKRKMSGDKLHEMLFQATSFKRLEFQ